MNVLQIIVSGSGDRAGGW